MLVFPVPELFSAGEKMKSVIFKELKLVCICFIFVSFGLAAEPEFNPSTRELTVPTLRVNGMLYRNGQVKLNDNGTWQLLAITAPSTTTNPICDIPRAQARKDDLEKLTEIYTPSFSTIEYLLASDMEAYDAICKMSVTPKLLEILNSRAKSHYPRFATIKYLTDDDLAASNRLGN